MGAALVPNAGAEWRAIRDLFRGTEKAGEATYVHTKT